MKDAATAALCSPLRVESRPSQAGSRGSSELTEWLCQWLAAEAKAESSGEAVRGSIYPVRDALDLMETCMQTMMDVRAHTDEIERPAFPCLRNHRGAASHRF